MCRAVLDHLPDGEVPLLLGEFVGVVVEIVVGVVVVGSGFVFDVPFAFHPVEFVKVVVSLELRPAEPFDFVVVDAADVLADDGCIVPVDGGGADFGIGADDGVIGEHTESLIDYVGAWDGENRGNLPDAEGLKVVRDVEIDGRGGPAIVHSGPHFVE